jgi:single-stranded-DNA-specific exonuclease
MSAKRWILRQAPSDDQVLALAKDINVNVFLASILAQRGVHSFEQAKDYFRPSLSQLHDPFLMKDMDKAVERILAALKNEEKILVYGDYDVDGTTSVSMMFHFLSRFTSQLEYYIPDRHAEGYGVSYQGIDYAIDNGFTLIVTLDCGIKSVEHVDYAAKNKVDFIICDHHNPGSKVPSAFACLDPKQPDCPYPYKELSGCGVGFKLIQAFCLRQHIPFDSIAEYLDLVAISIASDIVPITGENRILTYFGLQRINTQHRLGIKALVEVSGYKKSLTVTDVVFGLGPRINAAGRIKHAKASVELLLASTTQKAIDFAREINQKNHQRRDLDSGTLIEAIALIEEDAALVEAKSTVLFKNDWHKGVIGIVASKCIERYYRPTVILTESNGKATGSARTVNGFDLYEAISQCADLLEQYGGHTHAAGLTLPLENVPAFRDRFEEVVAKSIRPEQLIPTISIDVELPIDTISQKFYNVLAQMEPFGPGNMSPVFLTRKVKATNVKLLKEEHLKFSITKSDGTSLDVIGFGFGGWFDAVHTGQLVDLCYSIDMNEFNGEANLQLMLKDVKFSVECF